MMRTLPLLLIGGCDLVPPLACTEIGCTDGLTVELRAASGAFEAGIYSITLGGDACTVTVGGPDDCAADRCVVDSTCNGITLVGYDEADTLTLLAPVTEGEVALTVDLEGTVLLDESFEPLYETIEPNGPGCPPVCRIATETFDL